MIAVTFVRVMERHSDPRAADLRRVPVEELRREIEEILRHLSDWLLTEKRCSSHDGPSF
jgi:hypothetical protein